MGAGNVSWEVREHGRLSRISGLKPGRLRVKRGVEVRTPIMYMTSRMQLNEHWGFKRGDPLGWGLIFVAGLVLCEPEDFHELHESVLGGFPVLHKSFSSGPVFIAWSEQLELHVLVRNAISNL